MILSACTMNQQEPVSTFEPTPESFEDRELPAWFDDAKLGIFIHWGIYSVPAWATTTAGELGEVSWEEWFANNSYAEWYLNSLRIDGSPTQAHHYENWGEEFDYYDFAEIFNAEVEQWDPDEMAKLFQQAGARYVVLTTKHHDGFLLWPSEIENPHLPSHQQSSQRDIVGELANAVRERGMKFGVYYSGGIDWSFQPTVVQGIEDLIRAVSTSDEYLEYADAHWYELIEQYDPSILWNDIAYPSSESRYSIFAQFYNSMQDGVVNNRWNTPAEMQEEASDAESLTAGEVHADYTTPEYAQYDEITSHKWESTRGVGHSFGFNQAETDDDMISHTDLITSLVDIVSKNGNLLLNVGPKASGKVPEMQRERLEYLGGWLRLNGEAIYGTRPWSEAEGRSTNDIGVRFTKNEDNLYAILLGTPANNQVRIEDLRVDEETELKLLGRDGLLSWENDANGLAFEFPEAVDSAPAHVIKISPIPTSE